MKYSCLLVLLFLSCMILKAQDPEQEFNDFFMEMQQDFDTSLTENSKEVTLFIDSLNKDYLRFLQDAEEEFIHLLKSSFSEYELHTPDTIPGIPKPQIIPSKKDVPDQITRIRIKEVLIPGRKEQDQVIVIPSLLKNDGLITENRSFNFLGHILSFQVDSNIVMLNHMEDISSVGVSDYYAALGTTGYYALIEKLKEYKNMLNLNDWGFFLLVNKLARCLFKDVNTQNLVTWYLMLKAGYKVKIGYAADDLYVLFASLQKLYEMPYFIVSGDRYYAWNCRINDLKTYDCEYFNTRRYVDLYQDKPILSRENIIEKSVTFQYRGQTFNFNMSFDKQYVDYFSDYPKLDLHYYLSIPVSSVFKESVNYNLRPLLRNKNQSEALNILLVLVQHSFQYKTDIEQFGFEKYMLPEELFFYEYSDCDDRTTLFAYLVVELLNLDVIALDFKGHICTAVEITDQTASGNISYQNKNYAVCDPTYIGAPVGMLMPPYHIEEATAIDFNAYQNQYRLSRTVWDRLNEGGGYEANNGLNIVCDTHRNIYAVGIFKDKFVVGEKQHKASDSCYHAFLVKMNSQGETEWTKTFEGKGNSYSYCLANSTRNNLFLLGYFDKSVSIDGVSLYSGTNGCFFIAKITDKGDLSWIKEITVTKSIVESAGFTAIIDTKGNLIYLDALNNSFENQNKIGIDSDENCYLTCLAPISVFAADSGKNYADGNEFDLISYLVDENDRLINQHYPKSISLFYSIISFIKETGTSTLNGTALQNTLKSVNGDFPSDSPLIYDNIGKIIEIDKANGLIALKTIDQQPIFINPLKAEDNALVKLGYQHDNARLDVLNGVSIGNNEHWFKVNYILFDKISGEIVYSYDNHYQKKLPVQSEVIR